MGTDPHLPLRVIILLLSLVINHTDLYALLSIGTCNCTEAPKYLAHEGLIRCA